MKTLAALLLCSFSAQAADLLIAAASDLAPLTPKIEKVYKEKIRFTLASSGSLKQQIENGAPFDVFLSANEQYVRRSRLRGFGDRCNYLRDRPNRAVVPERFRHFSRRLEEKNPSLIWQSRIRSTPRME